MSAPSLPQHDLAPGARADALTAQRKVYGFTWTKYPFLAMAAELPGGERAPAAWNKVVNAALMDVLKNDARADGALGSAAALARRVADLRVTVGNLLEGDLAEAANDLAAILLAGPMGGKASSLDDYKRLFQTLPLPALAATFLEDDTFSRRFVAGADPEILERVTTLDPAFAITDAHLSAVSPGDTLAAAVAEGRLFVADYGMLDGLPPNDLGGRRYVYAPRAAFVVRPGTGSIAIFAIQIGREPGPENPVFTPAHGWGWTIAKTHVSVADTIAGAIWFHHARTHLVAEPMVVAAHRQLAPNHPLLVLLRPHFLGTLAINSVGYSTVFAHHGILDWFTGTPRDAVRELSLRSVRQFDFAASVFPRRVAARGIDDATVLRDFPYRDDGLLLWGALRAWIASYVGLYYPTDAEVQGDLELQSWVREIEAPDGGGIVGVSEAGFVRTREWLVDLVTQIIFSGSAIHAAMNFPVIDEMSFVPNSPFGAWAERPTRTDGWTEADWLAVLPPLDAAQRQLDTAWLLGASRYGKLGEYPAGTFQDPRVAPLLARYEAALAEVEATIDRRNLERPPYIHLKPSRVPPSINI